MQDTMNSYGFYVLFTPFMVMALMILFSGNDPK